MMAMMMMMIMSTLKNQLFVLVIFILGQHTQTHKWTTWRMMNSIFLNGLNSIWDPTQHSQIQLRSLKTSQRHNQISESLKKIFSPPPITIVIVAGLHHHCQWLDHRKAAGSGLILAPKEKTHTDRQRHVIWIQFPLPSSCVSKRERERNSEAQLQSILTQTATVCPLSFRLFLCLLSLCIWIAYEYSNSIIIIISAHCSWMGPHT